MLSEHRDMAAVKAFFRSAKQDHRGVIPTAIDADSLGISFDPPA
jgi:hypothetical protein